MNREELEEMYRRLESDDSERKKRYSVDDLILQVQKCKELGMSPTQHQEASHISRKFILALWEYVFLDLPTERVRCESTLA